MLKKVIIAAAVATVAFFSVGGVAFDHMQIIIVDNAWQSFGATIVKTKGGVKVLDAALQVGDVDAYADTAAIGRAPLLDPDPAITRQLLFMHALRLRMPCQALAEPLLFQALRLVILAAGEAKAKHLLKTHAWR